MDDAYDPAEPGELPPVFVLATGATGVVRLENVFAFLWHSALAGEGAVDVIAPYELPLYHVYHLRVDGVSFNMYYNADDVPFGRRAAVRCVIVDAASRTKLSPAEGALLRDAPGARLVVLTRAGLPRVPFGGTSKVVHVELRAEVPESIVLARALVLDALLGRAK